MIGAGMAGLSLAALLARQGAKVTVIDRHDPGAMATDAFDSRTVALSLGTKKILEALHLWPQLLPVGAAITHIDVQEGHDPFVLNFRAGDVGDQPFGWIFPNSAVRRALYDSCCSNGVTFVTGASLETIEQSDADVTAVLSDGKRITGALLIGADGRDSRVRALLGIDTVRLEYRHTALVGLIEHEHPHHGLALERFYPTGPFAALPFTTTPKGRHRSAIVWSRHSRRSLRAPKELQALTKEIEPMLDERYGSIEAVGTWAAFPLSLRHAKTMIAARVALISDAAHAMHPIAGQGLNLGMRDVEWLATHLPSAKDPGGEALLQSYDRARRGDVLALMAATDLLSRLFGNNVPPLRWARSLGLGIVERIPPLKEFFMRQAMGG